MSEITAATDVMMPPAEDNLIDVISKRHKVAIFPRQLDVAAPSPGRSNDWSLFQTFRLKKKRERKKYSF